MSEIEVREYHWPTHLENATQLLGREDLHAVPLLNGPRLSAAPLQGVEAVVDLSRLDLAFITLTDEGQARLGALTSLQELADSAQLGALASGLLSEAARLTAHYGLRHLATVGGALLAQDGPPEVLLALLALAASVVVHGQGGKTREQSLVDFVAAREQSLARDELVVEVRFAHPGQSSGALERVARTPRDEAIVAVAAILAVEEGVCRQARLALAGATSRPQRLWAVEQFLEGRPLTSDEMLLAVEMAMAEAVNPPADYRGSADYRRAMAGVLTRRALTSAWQRATTSNQESLST